MCRVAHALDLDCIDLAGLGVDFLGTQYTEVIGVDFTVVDHLIAHGLFAGGHVMLQRQLVGRLVDHSTVQRDLHRVAPVSAGDHLAVPVEVQISLFCFAQTTTFEVVGLWQQGVLVQGQRAFFGQAGDHHRRLEAEFPDAVGFLGQAAFGGAAHGQLFPVGGVAGGERLKVCRLRERQGEQSASEEQGATHKIS